ncbi:pirin-like C-terminal cupin domain-containing protein [Sphingomonas sp. BK235]|uniref:pirin family protein n=1 Tax=Sphingomonas sp. BK235 TaxID=2512131 RepID=UPI001FB77A09|nr:pirin-like C-terminal cupin domain-containing protein [Sphingomonas sp. BK235]
MALPREAEETEPSFSHHSGSDLPQWTEGGVTGHLIAGSAYGLTAGAQTHSPLFYAHLDLAPGASAEVPGGHSERAVYIASGAVEVDGRRFDAGKMLVLDGSASRVTATERSTIMLLGGEPVGERYIYWNFVSSSRAVSDQSAS